MLCPAIPPPTPTPTPLILCKTLNKRRTRKSKWTRIKVDNGPQNQKVKRLLRSRPLCSVSSNVVYAATTSAACYCWSVHLCLPSHSTTHSRLTNDKDYVGSIVNEVDKYSMLFFMSSCYFYFHLFFSMPLLSFHLC